MDTNYLSLRNSNLSTFSAIAINYSTLTGSTIAKSINYSTMTGYNIIASTISTTTTSVYNTSTTYINAPTMTISDGAPITTGTYGMVHLTRPSGVLDYKGYLTFIRNGSTNVNIMGYLQNSDTFGWIETNATSNPMNTLNGIFMTSSGNVGIGVTNPSFKLHVVGTLKSDVFECPAITTTGSLTASYFTASGNQKNGGIFFTANNISAEQWQIATIGSSKLGFNINNTGTAGYNFNYTSVIEFGNTGTIKLNEAVAIGANPTASSGSIILSHTTQNSSQSIVFNSANNSGSDFGYIQFVDTVTATGYTDLNYFSASGTEIAALVIRCVNDGPGGAGPDSVIIRGGSIVLDATTETVPGVTYIKGNVGIGITNPSSLLHVNGGLTVNNATTTDSLTVNNSLGVNGILTVNNSKLIVNNEGIILSPDAGFPGSGANNNPGYIQMDGFYSDFYMYTGNSWLTGIPQTTYYITTQYGEGNGVALIAGRTSWSVNSDKSLKKQIASLDSSLPCILQLNPVTFLYNEDDDTREKRYGFIAQEVQPLFPHAVSYGARDNKPVLLLSTTEFIPCIVKAVQEQHHIIQEQNHIITKQEETIKTQQSQLDKLIAWATTQGYTP